MNNKNKYFSKSAKHSVTKNTIKKSSIKKGDTTFNGLPINFDAMYQNWLNNENVRRKRGLIDFQYNEENPAFAKPLYNYERSFGGSLPEYPVFPEKPLDRKKIDLNTGDYKLEPLPVYNNDLSFNGFMNRIAQNVWNNLTHPQLIGSEKNPQYWKRPSALNDDEKNAMETWEKFNNKKKMDTEQPYKSNKAIYDRPEQATLRERWLREFNKPQTMTNAQYSAAPYLNTDTQDLLDAINWTDYFAQRHALLPELKQINPNDLGKIRGNSLIGGRDSLKDMFGSLLDGNKSSKTKSKGDFLNQALPAEYSSSATYQNFFNPNVNTNQPQKKNSFWQTILGNTSYPIPPNMSAKYDDMFENGPTNWKIFNNQIKNKKKKWLTNQYSDIS